MKILHIDTGRELRGGQHQLLLLLSGLAARGHEQILLAREPVRRQHPGQAPTLFNLWKAARKVDLIHAHDGRGHTLAALASAGKPLIVSRRVAFPVQQNPFSKWKYARADRYIAISNHVLERLREAGVGDSRISVVYDGVVPVPEAGPPDPGSDGPVLAPKINDPLKGSALVRSACQQAGVELRFSSDLPKDLPRAAAFVYLSESEGLGSAILLAMARKTPVIASRVGGIPELVEHEITGLLVENSVEQIAQALRRIMADRTFARQCAARAYERVLAAFTDDIMVRQTEQIYREVLDRRPPP